MVKEQKVLAERKRLTKDIRNLQRKIARCYVRRDDWDQDPAVAFHQSLPAEAVAYCDREIWNMRLDIVRLQDERRKLGG